MTHIKAISRILWCALLLGLTLAGAAARGQEVMVVANTGVSASQISSTELRDIFTGVRSRFGDGTRAVPVILKGGPAHEVFLSHHLGENPDEFRTRWRKAVFTGQGAMPKEFNSERALLEYVAATPGAIGYVSRVTADIPVKVLTVWKGAR
jgi:ABC-type phosphate transport system substrate-binding protein